MIKQNRPNTSRFLSASILTVGLFCLLSLITGAESRDKAGEYYLEGTRNETENTIRGRMLARQAYQKAIDRDPNNTLYLSTLAHLYADITMKENAIDLYRRVVELDSADVNAHCSLADLYTLDMEHFQHRRQDRISLDQYSKSIGHQAIEHYRTAVSYEPENKEVLRRFGAFALKFDLDNEIIECSQRLVEIDPNGTDGYFLMGIGFTRLANFAYAQAALEHAFNNLSAADRLSFTTVAGILSPEQLQTYRQLEGEERTRFEKTYWKKLDPLYLTDYNERVLTHLALIAYADLLFGRPDQGIRGWETDRGKVYIRYGEPRSISKSIDLLGLGPMYGATIEDFDSQADGYNPEAQEQIIDREHWVYPHVTLSFEDVFLSGKFRFDNPSLAAYDAIIKELPSSHGIDFKDRRFDFPYVLSTFDDEQPDRTLIEVNLGIPAGRFRVDDQLDEIRLKTGVFIFDEDWNTVLENLWDKEYQVPDNFQPEPDEYLHLVQQELVSVPPGSYNLALEVADRNGDAFGSHHITFAVPDYSGDDFKLGDLALALGTDIETGSAYNRDDMTVEPNPLMVFNRSDDLSLYFGVYNLGLDGSGRARYRITTSVARIDTVLERRSAFVRFLNNLLGRESEGLSISSEYRGITHDEIRVQTFDLSSLMIGLYKIEVTVTDLVTGVEQSREVGFSLIDRLRLLE